MSKQIPFSIDEFNKRGGIGKCKVVRSVGESVRILCTDGPHENMPVICAWRERVANFTPKGQYYYTGTSSDDIFILDESEPKWRTWKPEEVPVGAIIRQVKNPNNKVMVTAVIDGEVWAGRLGTHDAGDWKLDSRCEHSLDGGKTWQPCGVKEEA